MKTISLPQHLDGNLVWDADGAVWACYRADPWAYLVGNEDERLGVLAQIEQFAAALPRRTLISSVCRRANDDEMLLAVGRAAGAVADDRWVRYVAESVHSIDETYIREYVVAFRLGSEGTGPMARLRRDAMSAARRLRLAPDDAGEWNVDGWRAEAARLVATLGPVADRLEELQPSDIAWLFARASRRATVWEPAVQDVPAALPGTLIDADWRETRRSVNITLPDGSHTFATMLVFADLPRTSVVPDAAEWLWHLERMTFPVDWCVWVDTVDNATALRKANNRARHVRDQFDEIGGTGAPPPDLFDDDEALDDERRQLARTRHPLIKATYGVMVGAGTLEALNERVAKVMGLFPGGHYRLSRPVGHQGALLLSSLPGMPWHYSIADYHQWSLPDGLAAAAPMCSTDVGDPCGLLFGFRTTGLAEPVLIDPAWGPTRRPNPHSASLAVCGKTGSGKGVALKTLAFGSVAAGHQVIVVDRTRLRHTGRGEWVEFADAVPGTSQIIEFGSESAVTLDPLRCLTGDDAVEAAVDYLSVLLNVTDPVSTNAIWIERAVEHAANLQGGRLTDAADWLNSQADENARNLGYLLTRRAQLPGAWSVFHGTEVASMLADYTVLWVPDLDLPEPGKQVTAKQLAGQGAMLLLVAMTRAALEANQHRFSVLVLDEAWAVLQVDAGAKWVSTLARDGRKRWAGVWLASQSPQDIPDDIRDQLGVRAVFHVDPGEHHAALDFLGLPDDSDAVDLLSNGGGGRCLIRDGRGRIGAVAVQPPADPNVWARIDTTPRTEVA